MATLTAEYLDDLARVKLEAGALDPNVVYRIERSTDGGVTWVTVRGATNVTDGGVTVVYDYEYAPNVENRYRLIAPAISDTFERTVGPGGLVLDGTAGSYASTPDGAAIDIIGDIDIRVEVYRDDWSAPATEEVMVAKYRDSTNNRSYRFTYNTNGLLRFTYSVDGTSGTLQTFSSSVSPTTVTPNGTGPSTIALRLTRSSTTGNVTFYHSTSFQDTQSTWEPLGDIQPGPTGTMFNSNAPLEIGARDDGSQTIWNGIIIGAKLYASTNSSSNRVEVNFAAEPTGTTAFNDDTGLPWTVHGTAHILGSDTAWGSADTGQLWNLYVDNSTFPHGRWWVADGAGRVHNPDSSFGGYGRYLNVNLADFEVTYDFVMPSMATVFNDEAEFALVLRGTDDQNVGYDVTVWVEASTGRATLEIGGAGAFTPIELPAWQPGQTWRVRARLVGTVIEARAWNTANPEPTTWQAVTTSTNFTAGTVGLSTLGLTNDDYVAIYDNFIVYNVPPDAAATATVTPAQDDVWLKSIQFPSLNRNLGCIFTGDRSRRSRVGLFDVRGRHAVLAIFDVGSTETMAIQFITTSVAENEALTALLTWGGPLLLQSPPDDDPTGCGDIAAYPSGWFAPGDNTQARPLTGRRGWEWTVPLTRIAVPSPTGILPAHMTWEVLWQITANWVEVWDTWATWAELWDEPVAPGTMIDVLGS